MYVVGVTEGGVTEGVAHWRGVEKLTDLVTEDGPRLMMDLKECVGVVAIVDEV